jgi:hypothetical protein
MNTQRTPEELKAESKTLWYEFDQFFAVAKLLRAGAYCGDDTMPVHNALVESFAIHCRALCAFFFAGCKGFPPFKDGDLIAQHYVSTWEAIRPRPSAVLAVAKNDCDKQVAHMTAARRDLNSDPSNRSSWAITQIEDELRRVLGVFLDNARHDLFTAEAWAALKSFCPAPSPQTSHQQPPPIDQTARTCPPDGAVTHVGTIAPGSRMHGKTGAERGMGAERGT